MIGAPQLGLAYGVSEIALACVRRSKRVGASSHDGGTLVGVWIAVGLSVGGALWIARVVDFGRYEASPAWVGCALAVFALGTALRWWAICVLGRFFTVDVAIHEGHRIVQRGPYRVLRHPSYTGALLAFLGLGLLFESWPALVAATLPVLAILLWRIRVEERALAAHFGEEWCVYARGTDRLVPWLW